ncbi:MAG TPA: aldo/keto reductase [Candidatus Bipolaricaulota bacterium]
MEYVHLGKSGLKVSRLCLGTMTFGSPSWNDWVMEEEESRPFIARALELGINFFDTADVYSVGRCEEIVGKALWDFAKRDEVVLATKVFFPMGKKPNQGGLSRKHIVEALEASLRRLGTEYVDLYQIHRWDQGTPIEETLEALHYLVKSGKVLYVGASSMYAWQFAKALYLADVHGWTRFVSMQNHYNLIVREEEREMLPLCRVEGIGVIPWSPMARGFLAGNRKRTGGGKTVRSNSDPLADKRYFQKADFQIADRVMEVAKKKGVAPAQIALAWVLHQPGITSPIVGATKMAHLEEAVKALKIKLSKAECAYLEEPYLPRAGSF